MNDKELLRKHLISLLKKIQEADARESAKLANEAHSLYLKFRALSRQDPDIKIDLLPKSTTLRTANRTKDTIRIEALGAILSQRAQDGEVSVTINELKPTFSVWDGQDAYTLFLHNGFVTEELIGGYNLVSNIAMTTDEFLDFVRGIKERAKFVLERWGQEPNIISNHEV